MNLFGLTFILYYLKLSAGYGFCKFVLLDFLTLYVFPILTALRLLKTKVEWFKQWQNLPVKQVDITLTENTSYGVF